MDRPHVVESWLLEVLVKRKVAGGLAVSAPVLARVYALLSEAVMGYEQCRKIAETPFPFAFAQFMVVGACSIQ
jgi:predicted membrane chloride channel (bestrophin family)